MKILFLCLMMLMAARVSAVDDDPYSIKKLFFKALTVWDKVMDALMGKFPLFSACTDDVNRYWCLGKSTGRDCSNIKKKNKSAASGIYTIDPRDGKGPFKVYCDMTTDGGGWTVFQRRKDGSEDFYRTWNEYKTGFGHLAREFYLGNEKIHRLTLVGNTYLRVDLEDLNHNKKYATYKTFAVGSDSSNYKLKISGYGGTAVERTGGNHCFGSLINCNGLTTGNTLLVYGDALTDGNAMSFSTKDKDVDKYSGHCAQVFHGAWWYNACHGSNLNGEYGNTKYGQGVNWKPWKGYHYSLYRTEMKLKPQP